MKYEEHEPVRCSRCGLHPANSVAMAHAWSVACPRHKRSEALAHKFRLSTWACSWCRKEVHNQVLQQTDAIASRIRQITLPQDLVLDESDVRIYMLPIPIATQAILGHDLN